MTTRIGGTSEWLYRMQREEEIRRRRMWNAWPIVPVHEDARSYENHDPGDEDRSER